MIPVSEPRLSGKELAVSYLDLSPGNEVILPTFTFISYALVTPFCGVWPVLEDNAPCIWFMDVSQKANEVCVGVEAKWRTFIR